MSTVAENEQALQQELEAELDKVELLKKLISRIDNALIMKEQSQFLPPPSTKPSFVQNMWARVIRRN
jgi:hypothetical protein